MLRGDIGPYPNGFAFIADDQSMRMFVAETTDTDSAQPPPQIGQ